MTHDGGWIAPGDVGVDDSDVPEPVLTEQQWSAVLRTTDPTDQ